MDIVLLVVADCPNEDVVRHNLAEALDTVGIGGTPVTRVVVMTDERARELAFCGSPTVLLDGVDPFSTQEPHGFGLSCRVYRTASGSAGAPSVDQLVQALQARLA